jgi:four helix bundle protein
LTGQMRRAAVWIAANIVEAAARSSKVDYVRQLTIAYSSAKEWQYEISLARRLGYVSPTDSEELTMTSSRTARALWALIQSLRNQDPAVARRP